MMGWLQLLNGVLGLANMIAKICADKQLIKAGEHKQLSESLTAQQETVQRAIRIKKGVTLDNADSEL